jgi:hypothetical protein
MDDLIKKINELPDDVAHDEANLVDYEGDPFGMLKVSELKALTLHLSETQKKLDSARVVIEHYADTATWSPCESNDVQHRHYEADFIDSPDGMSNGWECARKWLDAEQGGE